jgi:hypothetical protein
MKKKRNIPNLTSSVRRDLTGQVKKDGDSCFAFGALADFWKGTWTVENGRDLSVRSTISPIFSPFSVSTPSGCRQSHTFNPSWEK